MNYVRRIIRQIINEYVTQDISALKNYLSMDDESTLKDMAYHYCWKFEDFLNEDLIGEKEHEELLKIFEEELNDSCATLEICEEKFPSVFIAFGEYVKGQAFDDTEAPSHQHMSYERVIKNQWLVHFTNDAKAIESNGFIKGTDDLTQLGYTYDKKRSKEYGGYNFAYTIPSFKRYARDRHGYKYGNEVVIFLASGIEVWHYGDEEKQTIFYGSTAKHINEISEAYGEWYIHNKKTGAVLYKNEYLENVVDWFVNNYNQYRSVLN